MIGMPGRVEIWEISVTSTFDQGWTGMCILLDFRQLVAAPIYHTWPFRSQVVRLERSLQESEQFGALLQGTEIPPGEGRGCLHPGGTHATPTPLP